MPELNEKETADFLREQGHDDKFIINYLKSQGMDPLELTPGAPKPLVPDIENGAHEAEIGAVQEYFGGISGMAVPAHVANQMLKYGAIPLMKAGEAGKTIKDWLAFHGTIGVHTTKNMLELAVGTLEPFMRPQQALFAGLVGEPRDEIIKRLIPEFTDEKIADQTPFMNSVRQLQQIAKAGVEGNWAQMSELALQNPIVIENMQKNLQFKDMLKAQLGDDRYNEMQASLNAAIPLPGQLAGMEVLNTLGDIFADPVMFIDPAVSVASKLSWYVKGEQKVAKALETGGKAYRNVGDASEVQRHATRFEKMAESNYLADTSVENARKLVIAQKRTAEANTIINSMKQGPSEAIYLRKAPHADPNKIIKTAGRDPQAIARDLAAFEEATPEQVKQAFAKVGFETPRRARQSISSAIERVAKGSRTAEDMEALAKWDQLPASIKKSLAAQGIDVPTAVRRNALLEESINPTGYLPEDLPLFSQRAIIGPDAAESAGDAARRLAGGAELEDITMHPNTVLGHEGTSLLDVPQHIVDGLYINELKTAATKARKDPNKTFQLEFDFPERGQPSILGKLMTPLRIMDSSVWPLREPQYALKGTGEYERIRGATINYEIEAGSVANNLTKVLEKAGILKEGSFGRHKIVSTSRNEQLFDLLDMPRETLEHEDAFQKVYGAADKELQAAHDEIRNWLNTMADRLNVAPDMRITGYAHHFFPPEVIAQGARPVEFTGLPATAEIVVNHLLDRTGKLGYVRDTANMLEIYSRASLRKIHMEPAYQDILDMAAIDGRSHIIKYTDDFVKELKGIPSSMDQHIDNMIGTAAEKSGNVWKPGSASRAALGISSMYYSALLAGNLSYLIQNIGTGVLNPLAKYGAFNTITGLFKMATPEGRAMAKAAGVDRQFARIFEDATFRKYSEVLSKFGPEQSEFFNRGLSFHAALSDITRRSGKSWKQLQDEGLAQRALADAIIATEFTQHVYGALGRSPMLSRTLGKTVTSIATQFLSFAPKQTEFLLSLTKDNPGYIMRYLAYSGMTQRIAAQELNIDASNFVGFGYFPTPRKEEVWQKSPGIQTLSHGMEWLAAANVNDPIAMEQASQKVLKDLSNTIPMMQAMRKTAETAKRLHIGEIRQGSEFVRKLQTNELPATLLQVPSIQDKRMREALQQGQQLAQNQMFLRIHAADQFVEAIKKGDDAKAAELGQRLARMGIMLSGDAITTRMQAEHISRTMRYYMKNPNFLGHLTQTQIENTPGFGETSGGETER